MSSGAEVRDELLKFIPKLLNKTKIAHVTTASQVEENKSYMEGETKYLKSLGCEVEEMTFEGCDKEKSAELLKDVDLIYVQGGNTFYLLKILKESGAYDVIKEKVENGVPYVGVSAGSYIACPTIEVATWGDQDDNNCGLKDLDAFNFVPFLMSVHFEEGDREVLDSEMKKTDLEVKILKDGQALFVEGGVVEFVGGDREIKI